MTLITFLVLGLATFRLTSLFSREHGPFSLFDRIRHIAGVRYDEHSYMVGTTELAKGLICPMCCSVWFGTIVCALYFLLPLTIYLWYALAFSAVACIISEHIWH